MLLFNLDKSSFYYRQSATIFKEEMLFFSVKVQLSLMSFVGDFVLIIEAICQKNSELNEPYQVEFFKKATSEMYIPDMKKIYNDFTFNHAFQKKKLIEGLLYVHSWFGFKKSCASR